MSEEEEEENKKNHHRIILEIKQPNIIEQHQQTPSNTMKFSKLAILKVAAAFVFLTTEGGRGGGRGTIVGVLAEESPATIPHRLRLLHLGEAEDHDDARRNSIVNGGASLVVLPSSSSDSDYYSERRNDNEQDEVRVIDILYFLQMILQY